MMNKPIAIVTMTASLAINPFPGLTWGQQASNKARKEARSLSTKEQLDAVLNDARSAKGLEREEALNRLASPDPQAKSKLETAYIELLDSRDPGIRSSAARACGTLQLSQATPKLKSILRSVPKRRFRFENDLDERSAEEYRESFSAAKALSDLGDFDSAQEILSREILAASWDLLLPKFGAKVLPALVKRARASLVNPAPVRDSALRTIAAVHDAAAVPQLRELLTDRDPRIRSSAARAIAAINTPEAQAAAEQAYSGFDGWGKLRFIQASKKHWPHSKLVSYARGFIDNPSNDTSAKFEMIQTLGGTGNAGAVPYLKELLKNPEESLRAGAACELAKITGQRHRYDETGLTRLIEGDCSAIQRLNRTR